MITVYQALLSYCNEQNQPPPTQQDLTHCGHVLSRQFRAYIFRQPHPPGTIIENTGFIIQQEDGKKLVVVYYPDAFQPEMIRYFDYYYSQKNKPKDQLGTDPKQRSAQPPKKRKRIPAKPTPIKEFSVKPSLGQIEGQS